MHVSKDAYQIKSDEDVMIKKLSELLDTTERRVLTRTP